MFMIISFLSRSARFLPSPCGYVLFVFQFAVRPTVPSPHHLCFRSVNLFVDIVPMLSFLVPIVTTNLCLISTLFQSLFSLSVVISLSCFPSSCRVANLTHHLLIENRNDSGGRSSLLFCTTVCWILLGRATAFVVHWGLERRKIPGGLPMSPPLNWRLQEAYRKYSRSAFISLLRWPQRQDFDRRSGRLRMLCLGTFTLTERDP
ncbi:hypothetical protein BJ322DRAFT_707328 [Thelephora terrestris]|uniref:Uncharacterized protein n=1 Tax=Thelephora terrestris TaxID=56493 RepID=A0A9P6L8X0_9AGAM|nr:hypothetical protein BJ322DRAFT_707328 [Thelephora terrestris]